MSLQLLTNKVNANSESHTLNVQEAEACIDRINANYEVAEYFAHKAGAVVVRLPDVIESDMALLDEFMAIPVELGDVCNKFQRAYADGNINKQEFKVISKEVDDEIAALLSFKASVGRVVR